MEASSGSEAGKFAVVTGASSGIGLELALQNELKDTEVTITSLMPGPTETEFFERADMMDTDVGTSEKDEAAQVAHQGFDALMAGEAKVGGGSFMNKVQIAAGSVVPDKVKAQMHRNMAEPGSAEN